MSPHDKRHDAKTDSNQSQIVAELKQMGFSVETGHDDLLVGRYGITGWFEIKSPDNISQKTKKLRPSCFTQKEKERFLTWRGQITAVWKTEQIVDWFDEMLRKLEK